MTRSRPVRTPLLLGLLLVSLFLCPSPGWAQPFIKLSFQQGKDTVASGLRFQLQEPDNAAHPQLWQGPLSVAHGFSQCNVDASLIHDVYLSQSGKLLVVVSLSGSDTFIHFFAPAGCNRKWSTIKAFTHGIRIEGSRLTLLPACEGSGQGQPYSCTAAAVYRLGDTTPPRRLTAASRAFTRREFGVAFTGTHVFERPPSAYIP